MATVCMTPRDVLDGIAGDCGRCAVSIAASRATGDGVTIFEDADYRLRIEVDGRSIVAPGLVWDFVRAFDDQPRDREGRLDVGHPDCRPPAPIRFELPAPLDPSWEAPCSGCGFYFAVGDDDERCSDCGTRVDLLRIN